MSMLQNLMEKFDSNILNVTPDQRYIKFSPRKKKKALFSSCEISFKI